MIPQMACLDCNGKTFGLFGPHSKAEPWYSLRCLDCGEDQVALPIRFIQPHDERSQQEIGAYIS